MTDKNSKTAPCALCGQRRVLTFHHLIPRKLHRRTFYKKKYSKEFLNQGILICQLCHKGIHKYYDEMTLAKSLSTLEALQADEALKRHIAWVAKQSRPSKK